MIASRRLGVRVPSLARAHPLCDARHAGDAVGQNPMDLAEAERSGLAVAAASTLDAGEDLTSLTGSAAAAAASAAATVEASAPPKQRSGGVVTVIGLSADPANAPSQYAYGPRRHVTPMRTSALAGSLAAAAVAAAATVEASATPCRRPPGRRMFVWLLLAPLLAPARAGCPGFTQQKNCGWGDCGAGCQNNEPAAIAADSSGANDKSVCLSWCDGLLPRQNIRNRNA